MNDETSECIPFQWTPTLNVVAVPSEEAFVRVCSQQFKFDHIAAALARTEETVQFYWEISVLLYEATSRTVR